MKGKSDEELMSAYVAGDPSAFKELFERYASLLKRMMLKNHCPEDVAKDLVQQTFLQVHRARLDFDVERPFRPWILTIGMNLLRGHWRGTARRPESPLEMDGLDEPSSEAIGFSRIEGEQQAERVRAAVAQLPESQRVVIEMHWFEERSFKEISAALGASLSAVKVRAHRGYQRLKLLLEETEAEETAS
jgi:RNA polymerase sigma factor (sigma-70 family)